MVEGIVLYKRHVITQTRTQTINKIFVATLPLRVYVERLNIVFDCTKVSRYILCNEIIFITTNLVSSFSSGWNQMHQCSLLEGLPVMWKSNKHWLQKYFKEISITM